MLRQDLAVSGAGELTAPIGVDDESSPWLTLTQRRFRVVENVEELTRALEYPWDKWSIFLHPVQREFIEKDYAGPARVAGSAGQAKRLLPYTGRLILLGPTPIPVFFSPPSQKRWQTLFGENFVV